MAMTEVELGSYVVLGRGPLVSPRGGSGWEAWQVSLVRLRNGGRDLSLVCERFERSGKGRRWRLVRAEALATSVQASEEAAVMESFVRITTRTACETPADEVIVG